MERCLEVSVSQLVDALPVAKFTGDKSIKINNIHWDYQKVEPNGVYFCLEEEEFQESHIDKNCLSHWKDAIKAGAICLVAQYNRLPELPEGISLIEVSDVNQAMALIAKEFYGNPLNEMCIIGITGTNGKTTTSQLTDAVLLHAGKKPGIIGTIGIFYPEIKENASHLSNPLSTELFSIGQRMKRQSVDSLVMEVTSHAMAFRRNHAIDFDVAIFTNLTQDHLDYHKTLEAYKAEKMKLFESLGQGKKKAYGIINIDDATGNEFINAIDSKRIAAGKVDVLTYGIRNKDADLVAYPKQMTGSLSEFDVYFRGNHLSTIELPMPGLFNIYNALAAFGAAFSMGIGIDYIAEGLKKAHQVDGRFEKVGISKDFEVYIDYAHTPDALEKILQEVKGLTRKRVICVYGCGGDRDRSKRPEMGAIADQFSDISIVTSDNPRTEDPDQIINDILKGIPGKSNSQIIVDSDRRSAIQTAVELAMPGDSVLIAGKGHEKYQIIGTKTYNFSDRLVAEEALLATRNKNSRAWVQIDRRALQDNFQLIMKDKPEDLKVLTVVKDNALGHGIVEMAREAIQAGCDYLGVACLSEALSLRQSGIGEFPILVFGERPENQIPLCVRNGLTVQIQSLERAKQISEVSIGLDKITKVHLKVDTGMGRYGVNWEDAVELYETLITLPGIEVEGIMTHFAQSDEAVKDYAKTQWERFTKVTSVLESKGIRPQIVHACNSGGYLDLPFAHGDMVRLGTIPTGVYPSKVCRRIELNGKTLTPVMSVRSRVAYLKHLKAGDKVGYGMHYTAQSNRLIAVLPMGYGDGYPRVRNTGYVLIKGQQAPIVGGNAMDAIMVDVTDINDVKIYDEVVLLGKQGNEEVTAMMIADWAGTVTYAITSAWLIEWIIYTFNFQGVMKDLSTFDFIMQGGTLLIAISSILIIMSILSWSIILRKWFQFKRAMKGSAEFSKSASFQKGLKDMYNRSGYFPQSYLSRMFRSVYLQLPHTTAVKNKQGENFERFIFNVERSIEKSIVEQSLEYEKSLSMLASISSSAPFIGLFGTVIGIIDSFYSIGLKGASDITVVAPGISTALITTAVGLFTAIPALMAFNVFREKIRVISNEIRAFGLEFVSYLAGGDLDPN